MRASRIDCIEGCIAISNEDHRFLVAEQFREAGCDPEAIILEPVGRNTAPAIAAAALRVRATFGADVVLLVLSSDHVIGDEQAFADVATEAIRMASEGHLVTFGIEPSRAETGYGYVRGGEAVGSGQRVAEFVEKPDQETAQRYLDSGEYFWNSGMFAFRTDAYLDELAAFEPEIVARVEQALEGTRSDLDFLRLDGEAFAACPAKSVDYAVMEKTERAMVLPLAGHWSDLGSWEAVYKEGDANEDGNVLYGDVVVEDAARCLAYSPDRLTVLLGIHDLIVADTPDALLVTSRERSQDVKQLVEKMRSMHREETREHRRVYRPWGSFEGVAKSDGYQVKRILVKPGAKLSLQMHHHRSEHWVVVAGTAGVVRDDEHLTLGEGESIDIPLGARHRLENVGTSMLEVIEIQRGDYLGEDDIVRFEDDYGRDDEDGDDG